MCQFPFLNSFPASGHFCHLLITFANSLDPDQARQNDLDPNCLTLWWHSWKIFSKKLIFRKKNMDDKTACKIAQHVKSLSQVRHLLWTRNVFLSCLAETILVGPSTTTFIFVENIYLGISLIWSYAFLGELRKIFILVSLLSGAMIYLEKQKEY